MYPPAIFLGTSVVSYLSIKWQKYSDNKIRFENYVQSISLSLSSLINLFTYLLNDLTLKNYFDLENIKKLEILMAKLDKLAEKLYLIKNFQIKSKLTKLLENVDNLRSQINTLEINQVGNHIQLENLDPIVTKHLVDTKLYLLKEGIYIDDKDFFNPKFIDSYQSNLNKEFKDDKIKHIKLIIEQLISDLRKKNDVQNNTILANKDRRLIFTMHIVDLKNQAESVDLEVNKLIPQNK